MTASTAEREQENTEPKSKDANFCPRDPEVRLSFRLEVKHLKTQNSSKSFKICHFALISFEISRGLKVRDSNTMGVGLGAGGKQHIKRQFIEEFVQRAKKIYAEFNFTRKRTQCKSKQIYTSFHLSPFYKWQFNSKSIFATEITQMN